jgi:hypothetical protein
MAEPRLLPLSSVWSKNDNTNPQVNPELIPHTKTKSALIGGGYTQKQDYAGSLRGIGIVRANGRK